MWDKDLPHNMCLGQWPTFHGPVILSYLEEYLMDECCTGDIQFDTNFDLKIYM